MLSQMTLHSLQYFFFEITALNRAKVETIWKVLIEKKSINKFYLTDNACVRLGVHSVDVNEELGRFADPM